MTKRKIEYWVIPPEADAEFVACMEEVLETYAKAYDPPHPVLCMDEQPVQLLKETRVPIPATKEHGQAGRLRIRTQRHGQHLHVRRTAVGLAASDRPRAENEDRLGHRNGSTAGRPLRRLRTVILVCDNLNTHTKGAFYEAFPPDEPGIGPSDRVLLHAQTRQLAEHRRKRTEFADPPMRFRKTVRRPDDLAIRDRRMVE